MKRGRAGMWWPLPLHAAGDAQCSHDSRQDADNQLDDELDSFFFHGIFQELWLFYQELEN